MQVKPVCFVDAPDQSTLKDTGKASETTWLTLSPAEVKVPWPGSEETATVSQAVLLQITPWCELCNLDTFKRKRKLMDSRVAYATAKIVQQRMGSLDTPHRAPRQESLRKAWKLQGLKATRGVVVGGRAKHFWGSKIGTVFIKSNINTEWELCQFNQKPTCQVRLCPSPSAHHDIVPGLPCLCWGENRKRG